MNERRLLPKPTTKEIKVINTQIALGLFIGVVVGLSSFLGIIASNFLWFVMQKSPPWLLYVTGTFYVLVFFCISYIILKFAIRNLK